MAAAMTSILIAERMHHFHFGGACALPYIVIDYKNEDFTQGNERYDTILAVNGYQPLSACRRVLKPQGTYVKAGGSNRQIFDDRCYPLHETADAIRNLKKGTPGGRL